MTNEMSPQQAIRTAAVAVAQESGGTITLDSTSPNGRLGFVVVRLPNGQEFTLRIEEN